MPTRTLVRRAAVAAASLAAAASLSLVTAGPASASGPVLYGRIPAGGCITGIPVVVNGVPLCYVSA